MATQAPSLTPRQIEILKRIIIEHTKSGEPVGSDILDKKYNLGVCPATVRSEMVTLAEKGYLKKSHFSSGRIPTAQAYRFYIQNILQEKELSTAEEVSYKSDVWDFKDKFHQLLQQSSRALAKRTHLLAISMTDQGDLFYSGINNVLDIREFWNIDFTKNFFETIDNGLLFTRALKEFDQVESEILLMLGEEDLIEESLQECASVFGKFSGKTMSGTVGVMGPARMEYDIVLPNVRYFAQLMQQIIDEQGY